MGLVELLVFYQQVSEYVKTYWELAKETLRQYLGPSPNIRYLIFDNDEVIPEGREHSKYMHVSCFNPTESRITARESTAPYKRLPWISIRHIIGDHIIDISDWMSEIRANNAISLLSTVRLASLVLNTHLPETGHAKVLVITRAGEEEEYKYHRKTGLLKRIEPIPIEDVEIHRRATCPYDVPDGLFF